MAQEQDFLQPGKEQVAAGYAIYGPSTQLVLTIGNGVHALLREHASLPRLAEQLSLYRAVLANLYPGRAVHAALAWTETLEIMELSSPALDAGLASALAR